MRSVPDFVLSKESSVLDMNDVDDLANSKNGFDKVVGNRC